MKGLQLGLIGVGAAALALAVFALLSGEQSPGTEPAGPNPQKSARDSANRADEDSRLVETAPQSSGADSLFSEGRPTEITREDVARARPEPNGGFWRVVNAETGEPVAHADVFYAESKSSFFGPFTLPADPEAGAWKYTADEQGFVRVPEPEMFAYLFARSGKLTKLEFRGGWLRRQALSSH